MSRVIAFQEEGLQFVKQQIQDCFNHIFVFHDDLLVVIGPISEECLRVHLLPQEHFHSYYPLHVRPFFTCYCAQTASKLRAAWNLIYMNADSKTTHTSQATF